MLGGCASGPTAAEKSACALATTQGAPSTLTFPPKPVTVYLIDPATLKAAEASSDQALAASARQWMDALRERDQAAEGQAATTMFSACQRIGA
jgi:hypothetical protein